MPCHCRWLLDRLALQQGIMAHTLIQRFQPDAVFRQRPGLDLDELEAGTFWQVDDAVWSQHHRVYHQQKKPSGTERGGASDPAVALSEGMAWLPGSCQCKTSPRSISSNRAAQLDGCKAWLRQELLKQKGIGVSLRTVERAVQTWREALRQSRQATVRYETRPGKQLQADFGELWVEIGGVRTKLHICVLTLGYSRRQVVRVFCQQQQRHWLQSLEEAVRSWDGVPEQVMVDNAKALVTLNNPRTVELLINPTFAAFARHWGFTPKACWPHRPQTKGKDERGVGYVKRGGLTHRSVPVEIERVMPGSLGLQTGVCTHQDYNTTIQLLHASTNKFEQSFPITTLAQITELAYFAYPGYEVDEGFCIGRYQAIWIRRHGMEFVVTGLGRIVPEEQIRITPVLQREDDPASGELCFAFVKAFGS